MNSTSIYTKQRLGLDKNVWLVMLTMSILSLGLLSYTIITKKDCEPFTFSIQTTQVHSDSLYFTGENISFVPSALGNNYVWNFGENKERKEGTIVTNKFEKPGKYYITASTNSTCVYGKEITVIPAPVVGIIDETIMGPSVGLAGKPIQFISTKLAKSYEWIVLYHPEIKGVGNEDKISFVFPSGGNYVVQVTLDNNRINNFKKEIQIDDPNRPKIEPLISTADKIAPLIKPDKPEVIKKLAEQNKVDPAPTPLIAAPVKPKSTFIADITFKNYIESLIQGQMKADDFNQYLCYGIGETQAVLNKKPMKFAQLCQEIMGKSKAKVEEVELKREAEGDKCVILVRVKLKKGKSYWLF